MSALQQRSLPEAPWTTLGTHDHSTGPADPCDKRLQEQPADARHQWQEPTAPVLIP